MAGDPSKPPHRVVVMGVAGCGKSTIGRRLAERLACRFVDGDDLHPPANVAKMRAGSPLTDADRAPWLEATRDVLRDGPPVVVACSALRRRYRDLLRTAGTAVTSGAVQFVFLDLDRNTTIERLAAREGHFMSAEMADSQYRTLERPEPDEPDVLVVDASAPLDLVVDRATVLLTDRS